MKANDWQRRFGASRRAKDKARLQALEQQIAAEDNVPIEEQIRREIARIFGRPSLRC